MWANCVHFGYAFTPQIGAPEILWCQNAREEFMMRRFETFGGLKTPLPHRSVHRTYLGATEATEGGVVSQITQLDSLATFVVDRSKKQVSVRSTSDVLAETALLSRACEVYGHCAFGRIDCLSFRSRY